MIKKGSQLSISVGERLELGRPLNLEVLSALVGGFAFSMVETVGSPFTLVMTSSVVNVQNVPMQVPLYKKTGVSLGFMNRIVTQFS